MISIDSAGITRGRKSEGEQWNNVNDRNASVFREGTTPECTRLDSPPTSGDIENRERMPATATRYKFLMIERCRGQARHKRILMRVTQ